MKKLTIILLIYLYASSLYAAEGGSSQYLPGFYGDFGMGTSSASGTYLNNFFGYNWGSNNDSSNSLLFELPGIIRVTETKILDGIYSFGFYPYALRSTYDTKKNNDKKEFERAGAGDMYAVPIQLSWQYGEVSFLAFEGIIVPTGSYEKNRDLNAGRNSWTFDNNFSITWLPNNGKYDLSLTFGYMVNTENTATHYRTGDEVHVDYSTGYYLTPSLGIGVTGSYYRQVTNDTGFGVPVNAISGEYSSIGPVVTYTAKMGERDVTFSTKWLHEYNVNNHIPSDYFIIRTSLKL